MNRFIFFISLNLAFSAMVAGQADSTLRQADLRAVQVKATRRDNFTSTLNPINIEKIGSGELRKAACCNLSESFETSGSVNISYTDAVTGAKEIEMLGLRGVYTQVLSEAIPNLQGLQSPYGLEYYPGSWLNEISLSKGASTVSSGAESIAGQLNFCIKQPENMERLFVNVFGSSQGRLELNAHGSHKFSEKLSTALFLHHNRTVLQQDLNGDGWLDMPHREQYNALNRWSASWGDWQAKIILHALTEKRNGGMMAMTDGTHAHGGYNFGMNTDRVQFLGKLGYVGFKKPYQNFGTQYSLTYQKMAGVFGTSKNYNGLQKSGYANAIYETVIEDTRHKIKLGANYTFNRYDEFLTQSTTHENHTYQNALDLSREERVLGTFGEYNWSPNEKFTLLAGVRLDAHNLAGLQLSPRLNLKYNFDENTVVRASAGRGFRLANAAIENLSSFISARTVNIESGLKPEIAWNYGLNFTHSFKVDMHDGQLNFDLYRTQFKNRIITDLNTSRQAVFISNLQGNSVVHSALLTASYFPMPRLEVKIAYKWTDVQTTQNGTAISQFLQPAHRGLVNLHYETFQKDWNFNLNTHLIGTQLLPTMLDKTEVGNLAEAVPAYRYTGVAPAYLLLNAQVNKTFATGWEVYVGGENLTNYKQDRPILSADDPSSRFFDASTVFAPIMGAMMYVGMKWTLN